MVASIKMPFTKQLLPHWFTILSREEMFAVTYTSEHQLIKLSQLQFLVRPENGKEGENFLAQSQRVTVLMAS